MRSILHRGIILLVLVSMTATAAFARNRRAHVTFSEDTLVNGTLVKKGDYQIKFDQSANELNVLRHGKMVAQSPVTTQPLEKKARSTQMHMDSEGADYKLLSVEFGGTHQLIVLN